MKNRIVNVARWVGGLGFDGQFLAVAMCCCNDMISTGIDIKKFKNPK
jgi:hypothetical protein